MNATIHPISSVQKFTKLVTDKKLTPGGIYIVALSADTAAMYQAITFDTYRTISGGGSGGGSSGE